MSYDILDVKRHDAKKRYSLVFDKLFNHHNSKKVLNKKFLDVLFKMSQNKIEHSEIEKDLENGSESRIESSSALSMHR